MASGISDLISGLREAEDQYRQDAAEAFAGVELDICGIPVLPMTPKMFIDLDGAGNAFFGRPGTPITAGDCAAVLWRCSPCYTLDPQMRSFFNAHLALTNYNDIVDGITAYIERSWSGMPLWPGKPGKEKGLGQWPSRLVHLFAKEYSWKEEYILNLPFRRLWQYANRILEEHDPKYKEKSAKVMKLREEWLIAENSRQAAAKIQEGRN